MSKKLKLEKWHWLKKCPVCSSENIEFFQKGNLQPEALDEKSIKITASGYGRIWDLYCCRRCSHIFANPAPFPETINKLYSLVEDPVYEEEAGGRAKNFIPILNRLEILCPEKGKLLDVGAATGILLDLARDRNWKVEGVEPSEWAAEVALRKHRIKLIKSPFEETALKPESFDALTMVDFIEHILDPLAACRKASLLLKPEAVICLVTPDIQSLAARLAGKRWWHYRPAHLAFFTTKSLFFLLRRCGFQPLIVHRYSWTFSLYYLLSRFSFLQPLLQKGKLASFCRKYPVKLVLGDSLEVYARKEKR
ncbi:MAG: class I SAM-dependent methyltransferase [Acidobacteriota bacterium]